MNIKLDASAFNAALSMLGELAEHGANIPLDLLQASDQFVRFDLDTASAGTDEMIVLLKPSDRLLRLLTASGAGDRQQSIIA